MKNTIAVIAPEVFPIPPVKGGAVEGEIYETAKEMRGFKINIFSTHSEGLPQSNREGEIQYFWYRRSWLDNLALLTYKLPFKNSRSFGYWLFYSFWCARLCRRIQANIIHIHNRWQFVAVVKRFNPDAKIFLHIHQVSALNFSKAQAEYLKKNIYGFISCSDFLAQKIREKCFIAKEKIFVVKNGADLTSFQPASETEKRAIKGRLGLAGGKVILYAGRLAENKGAHILLQAFNKLTYSDVTLILAGGITYSDSTQNEYLKSLKTLAEGKKEKIKFLGHVPHEKIPELYKAADIFAIPSQVEEALGISLIEAMATGLTVIGSKRGGIPELIEDKENGVLVNDYSNPDAWRQRLDALLENDALSVSLGKKARQKTEVSLSWKHSADSLKHLYNQALANTKTKVLFIETGSGFGGSAKYLYELTSRINKENFEPYVIYSGYGPNIKKVIELGIPARRINLFLEDKHNILLNYLYLFYWLIFRVLPNIFRIAAIIKKTALDIVYLNNELLSHLPSIIAAKLCGKKVICHNHGLRQLTFIERKLITYVDLFVCVSNATLEAIKEDVSNKPAKVVYNGLDTQDFDLGKIALDSKIEALKKTKKLVGIYGRIVEWKGHSVFVEAAAGVLQDFPDTLFLVIGDDLTPRKNFLKEVKRRVKELGIENSFVFTGWQEDTKPMVLGLDIVVHPSIKPEPFGLAVIEAMALERPVVASRLGALPEIIDDTVDGILFEPNNPQDLAQKIKLLLADDSQRQKIGKAARIKVANNFSIDKNIRSIESLL
ncbi:MAG: hypothetical protein A2Y00_03605 [Omnitrophica WOR_2 bacterium GWF2_43_52]|nr:MAG: hypothetical protein A2Y01_04570 [Omnitrophica WOR_2 bacterium GWC2_44_8]OGX22518.1 MAG: hypothetical protein A2Y00_03605 [Omnitrophica WOR_2 bacterium GWF2_43_52]HAH21477.1 hypothetical protein [Candidatus Omnitrophota bacterium]HBG64607.1 hypothetical protein [Candidatus Omnitrophota bacterium]HCD38284.1 hypothetical protein [Candidatus Omnitrophota bacterium]